MDASNLTDSRRGAWIINITKHLVRFEATHAGLAALETVFFAGKAGTLLIKLSGDETEQIPMTKARAHARVCGIGRPELPLYLDTLEAFDCIDTDREQSTVEVLAFTRQRVLITTARIFEGSQPTPLEAALLAVLEHCLSRPRLESELQEFLSELLSERDIVYLLGLIEEFGLLGAVQIPSAGGRVFFNEYQFGDRAQDIGKALKTHSRQLRDELDELLGQVAKRPGVPPGSVPVSDEAKALAVGFGLVEISEVASVAGTAAFFTAPRLAPPSVGRETSHLEDDVFHHAKMLLSSLRFGELRSTSSRGRIMEPPVLVKALLSRDRVGPCTAIGEDYVILESEGVIRTVPAPERAGRQFYLEIRRREPAEIVLDLLEAGSGGVLDARSLPQTLELPHSFTGPEVTRIGAARRTAAQQPEVVARYLEGLRTFTL